MKNYFDIGYPENFGDTHIGLYQPVIGCFLLTLCNYQDAQEIMIVASSRYNLLAVDLTSAENYCPNLIDNECCENWSLPVEDSRHEIYYRDFLKLHTTKTLIQSNTNIDSSDICLEKDYLQTVLHYLKYFNHELFEKNSGIAFPIKNFLKDVLDIHDTKFDFFRSLKSEIMRELFFSHDIEVSKSRINNIISTAQNKYDVIF
jgi:hypothetical protein